MTLGIPIERLDKLNAKLSYGFNKYLKNHINLRER